MIMLNNTALAMVRVAEQRFEEARYYCQLAEKVSAEVDDAGLNGRTYLTFGKVILKEMEEKARKGDIDHSQRRELLEEAVEWFERADKYLSSTQDYARRAELYGYWGDALEDLGQAEQAILCWKRGYEALSSASGPTWD
jgi:tetratricopeptide (TPR) repeat protein